jgi:hypothetical protein
MNHGDKILELLKKAGCKPELVDAIGEALVTYKTTIQEQFEADYTTKVNQAKKICIEETENHKRELARRFQVFVETRAVAIDSRLKHHMAISESEASAKLRTVKSVLEDVEVIRQPDNGKITAVVENSNRTIQQLTAERDRAVEAANRQTAIAEKIMKRNRALVAENGQLRQTRVQRPAVTTEGRQQQPRRIDQSRRGGTPTTSRSTLVESQTRIPAQQPQPNNVRTQFGNGFAVDDIAAQMDTDLL